MQEGITMVTINNTKGSTMYMEQPYIKSESETVMELECWNDDCAVFEQEQDMEATVMNWSDATATYTAKCGTCNAEREGDYAETPDYMTIAKQHMESQL